MEIYTFFRFYMWEILHSTIKRTVKSIKRCNKELEEAKVKNKQVCVSIGIIMQNILNKFLREKIDERRKNR